MALVIEFVPATNAILGILFYCGRNNVVLGSTNTVLPLKLPLWCQYVIAFIW